MFNKDSVAGTLIVVVLLSLICSIIVAGSAVSLKPAQVEQHELDKQKNILSVAGLLEPNINIKDVFDKNIETRYVDLASGKFIEFHGAYDADKAAKDPGTSIKIDKNQDKAGIRSRAKIVEVYLVKKANGQLDQIILPIYGTGLWSVMHAFVSIQPDGNTINGITYYAHGETPGLGGEIENPRWASQFKGKELYSEQGLPVLHVSKGGAVDVKHGVDGLSGATLTSNGVQHSFEYWFGGNAYGPFLKNLKAGEF